MSGYENYTLSPVPWIKQMPGHWGLVRGKNLYQKMQRPTSDTDEVVTCFRDGTVTLRKNRRTIVERNRLSRNKKRRSCYPCDGCFCWFDRRF